jgi:hypothetical protein
MTHVTPSTNKVLAMIIIMISIILRLEGRLKKCCQEAKQKNKAGKLLLMEL